MRNTFRRPEKLKKKNLIAELFASGESVSVFPLKMIYLECDHDSTYKIQAGVSVSKRNFNKAVERNHLKRLIREAYRRNKYLIYKDEDTKKHIIMFIYQAKNKVSFEQMEAAMIRLIQKFLQNQKSRTV